MALTTFLSDEIELDTIVAELPTTPYPTWTGEQIWQPFPLALSGDLFVVRALYTPPGNGSVSYYRYYVLNAEGQRLNTQDFVAPYNGNQQPTLLKVDATHWLEVTCHAVPSTSNELNVRRFSIDPASGRITMDYENVQLVALDNSQIHLWASAGAAMVNGVALFGNTYSNSASGGVAIFAFDTTNGNVLWHHLDAPTFAGISSLALFATDGKFTLAAASYAYPSPDEHWWRIEYTFDKNGCTPGAWDEYRTENYNDPSMQVGYAPALWLNPYMMGDLYSIDLAGASDDQLLARLDKAATDVLTLPTGFAGNGPETWPWFSQSNLRFAPVAGRWYQYPATVVHYSWGDSFRSTEDNGVRILVADPDSGTIEMSDIVYPHLNGVVGDGNDYYTWPYWDETSGGSIATAYDPGTGVGVLSVGWVAEPAAGPQYLMARAWIVQGPSNKPNLAGKPLDSQLNFS